MLPQPSPRTTTATHTTTHTTHTHTQNKSTLPPPVTLPPLLRQVAPYVWTREFEHASVRLDLNKRENSAVTYHSIVNFTEEE